MAINANTPVPISLVLLRLSVPLMERRLPDTCLVAHPLRHLKESQELPCLLIVSLSPEFISLGYVCPYFGNRAVFEPVSSHRAVFPVSLSLTIVLSGIQKGMKSAQSASQLVSVSVCTRPCVCMCVFSVVYQGVELRLLCLCGGPLCSHTAHICGDFISLGFLSL